MCRVPAPARRHALRILLAEDDVVNQMIGDGLMAIFGAPQLPDPAPLAAVRAALNMIELFNVERAGLDKEPIRIGIGIATGEVVAGHAGTQQRARYTCIGNTANRATRLQAHTRPTQRGILIDGATQRALGDSLPLQPRGDVLFKAMAEAVPVSAVKAQAQGCARLPHRDCGQRCAM